jgi:hypothetical protein
MENNGFKRLRQLRRAEFVGAVVAHQHVFDQQRQLRRKIRKPVDLFVDELDFHDEVAQGLTFIGIVDGALRGEFINLADVVQKTADQEKPSTS